MNKDYSSYKATDFLLDDTFRSWMTGHDREVDRFWKAWLAQHPHRAKELEQAKTLFLALQFKEAPMSRSLIEEEWQRLQTSIETNGETDDEQVRSGRKWFSWAAAASVALLLISGWAYRYFQVGTAAEPEMAVIKTVKGQRINIVLKDGTKVLLNSGSSISYPDQFATDKREVQLTGEAFFDVTPNPDAPFLITSGDVTTEVVGTSFGISAYPGTPSVQVAVVSGKVKVYSTENQENNSKLSITPSQMATFQNTDKVFAVSAFDQDTHLGWIDNVLYFDKDNFEHVIKKLENWYGVTIVVDPALNQDPSLFLTGKFKNKSLQYVLDSYRYPNRFDYQIKNDTVKIH